MTYREIQEKYLSAAGSPSPCGAQKNSSLVLMAL